MTAPTPAVERAAEALAKKMGSVRVPWDDLAAQAALTAALTDPDDPDSLARTLYVLQWSVDGHSTARFALERWGLATEESRGHWRAVADGLRMMLTGSA